MKSLLLLTTLLATIIFTSNAQVCTVSSATAYSMQMPGITHFTLNTIDRTSSHIECGGVNCNSYVATGESTELEQGMTYTATITHTRDSVLFPLVRNNLRIWIDYNQNDTLDDAGEEVLNIQLETFGTSSASFTVPTNAPLGSTTMRVTAKMSNEGGHIDPSPCDMPPDPIDYHGEIEDYTVTITAPPSGIKEIAVGNSINVFPNPTDGLINIQSKVKFSSVEIFDMLGAEVYSTQVNDYSTNVDLNKHAAGIYLYTLKNDHEILGHGKITVY